MTTLTPDQQILERYLDQPPRLPPDLRPQLETALEGPVRLYALADLDAELRLSETWIALGDTHLAAAWRHGGMAAEQHVVAWPRAEITAVRESPGLSGSGPASCEARSTTVADGSSVVWSDRT